MLLCNVVHIMTTNDEICGACKILEDMMAKHCGGMTRGLRPAHGKLVCDNSKGFSWLLLLGPGEIENRYELPNHIVEHFDLHGDVCARDTPTITVRAGWPDTIALQFAT